ncbi:MAG: alkaline ceramidase [Rhizobiaceae bacterium]|nr:alkaline ceramidase [Rhizobiaceae bacterium]
MIRAGTAVIDITPLAGQPMSGFAARSEPALGTHDPLTVRAIAVNKTAIVVADVIGIRDEMSERIRRRCILPDDAVVVAALHNHGGPVSMAGRLGQAADAGYLQRLEDACVKAVDDAVAAQCPAALTIGGGRDPGVARNRRHPGGIVDNSLPVLRIHDSGGKIIAVMVAYACHPVVLGADNRLWTADYPHFVRKELEAAYPGATAIFLTGCVGDANTGHSAQASITLNANAARTFAEAERLGTIIAKAAIAAGERSAAGHIGVGNASVTLQFSRREVEDPQTLARRWREDMQAAEPARRVLLKHWIAWAEEIAPRDVAPLKARVTVLDWGGVPIIALPGEIFAETARSIRDRLNPETPAFIIGFAEDNPGYIPPAGEYSFGGYEVDEAHRYYGMPASFAPGSAEALAAAAISQLHPEAVSGSTDGV